MNSREDWNNQNPYLEQFVPSHPLPNIFAPPISNPAMNFGFNSTNWVQVPPQTMPWGTPPESQPAIVKFTAGDFNPNAVPIKRKCESPMEVGLPTKMLVTEEKMAAHMRDLHISDVEPTVEPTEVSIGCKEEPMEAERLPKLVLNEGIKDLKFESIIPDSILKKLEKPEMALVLWQPPATDLDGKLRELKKLSVTMNKKKPKENQEMEIAEDETETNTFRPIDPVPMPSSQNTFFQPIPQFQGFPPFSQTNTN